MGDERDQDGERTPLWPPDPEPGGETAAPPNWSVDPSPAQHLDQPWDAAPHATNAPWPQPAELEAPWPPETAPASLSDAPTERVAAFPPPTESEAPTERIAAFPPSQMNEAAPHPSFSEGPTMRVSAAPAPPTPDAATQRAFTSPPTYATPTAPDAATQRVFTAPPVHAAPTEPAAPPAPPAPKPALPRRSGLLWRLGVTFAISALLLVGALSLYRHAQDLAAQPVQVMASYCAAIEHDNYHAAYALLAPGAQAQISETQYLADAADRDIIEGGVTACAGKPTVTLSPLSFLRAPRSLIFDVTIARKQAASGQIALSRDTSGWHVAALSSPLQGIDLGPLATQRELCAAFNQRKYDQAFALLSTPYQREQGSAASFTKAFGGSLTITACKANLKTYTVNPADQQSTLDATLTVSFVGATTGSPPSVFTVPSQWTLVREAGGWRVDNIKPMLTQ